MKDVDISYSYQVQQALMHACHAAEECCNTSVGTEHLLIGILKIKDAKLTELLNREGITDQSITHEVQILFGFDASSVQKGYTSTLNRILKDAEERAYHKHHEEVSIDELSSSLLQKENNVALELLRRSGIVIEQLIDELNQIDIFHGIQELKNLNQSSILRKGKVTQREKELQSMIHVLMRMEKSNCVLTGEAGVGKTAIVEELARRIEKKQVPEQLYGYIVAELNVNMMVAGTKYRGEFEKKMQYLLDLLKKEKKIILFIDELHLIVGAGKAEGSLDVASVLKPVLAREGFKVIGATTHQEYERWIQNDKALQRRFVRIDISEPDEQMTLDILKEKAKDLCEHHQVKLQRGLLKECIHHAKYLFPERKFPDKAIDLLDMSCAITKCFSQDLVSIETLKQAASQMTQWPVDIENGISEFQYEIKNSLNQQDMELWRKMLNQVLQYHGIEIFELVNIQQALLIEESLKNYLHAEIVKMDASLFDSFSFNECLNLIYQKLKNSHFQVLWFTSVQHLRQDLKDLLEKKTKEVFSMLPDTCIIKGVMIVFQYDQIKQSIGFFNTNEMSINH